MPAETNIDPGYQSVPSFVFLTWENTPAIWPQNMISARKHNFGDILGCGDKVPRVSPPSAVGRIFQNLSENPDIYACFLACLHDLQRGVVLVLVPFYRSLSVVVNALVFNPRISKESILHDKDTLAQPSFLQKSIAKCPSSWNPYWSKENGIVTGRCSYSGFSPAFCQFTVRNRTWCWKVLTNEQRNATDTTRSSAETLWVRRPPP